MEMKTKETHPIGVALQLLLSGLCAQKRSLRVAAIQLGNVLAVEIKAHADDLPKLVGKEGKHLAAINLLLRKMGERAKLKVVPNLLEPPARSTVKPPGFRENPHWKSDEARQALDATLGQLFRTHPIVEELNMEKVSIFQVVPRGGETMDEELENALAILFDATGKAQGRLIQLTGPERK